MSIRSITQKIIGIRDNRKVPNFVGPTYILGAEAAEVLTGTTY